MIYNINSLTAVVTVHRNPRKLLSTIASLEDAGVSNIIIAATYPDEDLASYLRTTPYRTVIIPSPTKLFSHEAWLRGVLTVSTEYTILLHDGDIVIPETIKSLCLSEDLHIFAATNITGTPWRHEELCDATTSADITRVIFKPNTRSLSPAKGIFKTSLMRQAMIDFCPYVCRELIVNEDLVIGNDLYLWANAAMQASSIQSSKEIIAAFDTEDSTTVKYSSNNKLEILYDIVRSRIPFSVKGLYAKKSFLTTCYFGPNNRLTQAEFLDKTVPPFKIFPTESLLFQPSIKNKDQFGYCSFLTQLRYCSNNGWDYMLLVEDDCAITKQYNTTIINEFDQTKLFAGSIVSWGFCSAGVEFQKRWLEFYNTATKSSGIPPAIEGNGAADRTAIYPNGALTIYNIRQAITWYGRFYINPSLISNQVAWDLDLGYMLYDHYRSSVFNVIQHLNSTYSGCGDHHVTQEFRESLIASGSKVAVHKI